MSNRVMKNVLCLVLAAAFMFASGCAKQEQSQKYNSNPKVKKIGSGVVTDNGEYSLLWDEARACVMLKEISSGKIWSTVPYDYYTENSSESFQDIICASPLIVKYLTSPDNTVKTLYGSSVYEKGAYSAKLVKNGIKVTYYFHTIEAVIPVTYRLQENYLEIEINTKEIKEGAYPIYQIAVAPFLSSVKNGNEQGSLFVPSGSGAVIKTSDTDNRRQYEEPVYGEDAAVNKTEKATNASQIKLPFFASSNGKETVVGIIDSGAGACNIAAQTGDTGIKYSSVYPVLCVRGYNLLKVNMVYAGATQKSSFYHDLLIEQTLKVRYYPFENTDNTTVETANVYRDYLKSKGFLKERVENEPLYLQIVGGMTVNKLFAGFPYKAFESATTLEEAERIIEDVKTNLGITPVVQLKGFGTSGVDVDKLCGAFKIASDLGDWKALKGLEASDNLFFDFDIFRYRKGRAGINSAAKTANAENAYQYDYDMITGSQIEERGRYKLISRSMTDKISERLNETVSKNGLVNISLGNAGYMCYSDYSDVKYYQKGSMASDIGKLLKETKTRVMTECSNDYAAIYSDHILDSPVTSSKKAVFDYDVPMYQIVFKGYRSMSAQQGEYQILDAVETGIGLKYTVCDHFNPEFIGNPYDSIAYGVYFDVRDELGKEFERVKTCLEATKSSTVSDYSILENGVTKTLFDNGVTVYVNRSDVEQSCDLGVIEPMSFLYS